MPIRSTLVRGWPLALLALAPVISVARIAVVGALLPVPDFALYSSVVAAGTFLSTLLSFGQVEQTIKSFPRLVADGREGSIVTQTRRIVAVLLVRAALLGLVLYGLAALIAPEYGRFALATAGIALGVALYGLLASVQRAFAAPARLALGTIVRVAFASGAVSIAALTRDLVPILLAEAGAMLFAAVLTWMMFFRHLKPGPADHDARAQMRAGVIVFAAQSSAAVPFYLDRAYVTSILPGFAAGQYAVLALGILAGSLLVATVIQKTGPETIVLAHRGEIALARRHAWRWMSLTAACWSLAMGAAWVVVAAGWVPAAYARYGITPAMLLPVWLIGLLLNSGKLEFLVLALDREWRLLRAALLFLGAVLIGAALIAWQGGTIMAVLWGLVAARAVYFAALWHASRPGAEAERRLDAGAVEALAAGPTDPAAPASAAGPGERAG